MLAENTGMGSCLTEPKDLQQRENGWLDESWTQFTQDPRKKGIQTTFQGLDLTGLTMTPKTPLAHQAN